MKTSQPKTPRGRRTELAHWLETVKPEQVGEAEWDELRRQLAPVSESYLRKLLRESGVPLAALVEGVRQETLEALESSLLRMLTEYETGARERKALVRKAVITAKDHARLASRKEEVRAVKEEMILWMLTWLENPVLFPDWLRLRKNVLYGQNS
jgi:hypothetical protein